MPDHDSAKSIFDRKLEEYEDQISKNSFETALLLDRHGNLLFSKKGNNKTVRFSTKDLNQMFGNVLTHNHPFSQQLELSDPNTSAFSSADLALAYQQKPKEIRMVIGNERHSFQWTGATKQEAQRFLDKLLVIEEGAKAAIEKVDEKMRSGGYKTTESYYTAYCATARKYFDRINLFFEEHDCIGYRFKRGRRE